MDISLDGITRFSLNQFTGRYMLHFLARFTSYVNVRMGNPSMFDVYMDRKAKGNTYDIEHILPDRFDDYAVDFVDAHEFQTWRQHVGNDIIDQRGHSTRIGQNLLRERGDVFRLHCVVGEQFRITGDRVQRRFQFMRNVGGEFTAHLLCFFLFRNVKYEQNGSGDCFSTEDWAYVDLIAARVSSKRLLHMFAVSGTLQNVLQFVSVVEQQDIFPDTVGGRFQYPAGGRVDAQNGTRFIEQDDAFAHMAGRRLKFISLPLQV